MKRSVCSGTILLYIYLPCYGCLIASRDYTIVRCKLWRRPHDCETETT